MLVLRWTKHLSLYPGCCSYQGWLLALCCRRLDQCSLASTAASCWQLSREVPAYQSSSVVRCRPVDFTGASETFDSFSLWLARHSTSLRNLIQCSIVGDITDRVPQLILRSLPCPQLRHLHLQGLRVQLEPGNGFGCPGVLYECTGLTALALKDCALEEVSDAFAAIAALPELRHLTLETTQYVFDEQGRVPFAQLQRPSQLTHLSLQSYDFDQRILPEQLEQLSALVNLKHLHLGYVPNGGVPGGLPSQLQKLTCLQLSFSARCNVAEQLQHISSLTALQHLSVDRESLVAEAVSGIKDLTQLTHLRIQSWGHPSVFIFSTASTGSWACLAALQSLDLTDCIVQPAALARLTQLRALSIKLDSLLEPAPLDDLFDAVSRMSLLTHLHMSPGSACPRQQQLTPAAAFTALTASTHLCSLQLIWPSYAPLEDYVLFKPGREYTHLRLIRLRHDIQLGAVPKPVAFGRPADPTVVQLLPRSGALGVQTLQELHSHSPLTIAAVVSADPLGLCWHCELGAAVGVVAQLTGLKQLFLHGLLVSADPLLQLTALTALEKLMFNPLDSLAVLHIENKARWCSPPDVCLQLLRELDL